MPEMDTGYLTFVVKMCEVTERWMGCYRNEGIRLVERLVCFSITDPVFDKVKRNYQDWN